MDIHLAIFCYNRADTLARTIEALRGNTLAGQTHVTFYSDAAKSGLQESQVSAVRNLAGATRGFKSVRLVARPVNFGLRRNILDGMNETLAATPQAIFIEDDVETSTHFIAFMQDALSTYINDDRLSCVAGFSPLSRDGRFGNYTIPGAECMAIGTWRRVWDGFDPDPAGLLARIRSNAGTFNFAGAYDFAGLLERCAAGDLSQWAVMWRAHNYLEGRHSFYPGSNMARHIGEDQRGTHYRRPLFRADPLDIPVSPLPVDVKGHAGFDNPAVMDAYRLFLKSQERRLVDRIYWRGRQLAASIAAHLPRPRSAALS